MRRGFLLPDPSGTGKAHYRLTAAEQELAAAERLLTAAVRENRPDLDEIKELHKASIKDLENVKRTIEQQSIKKGVRASTPFQSSWAVYIDSESIKWMLWGMGELFIRCSNVTLAELKMCNPRAKGGFMLLYLLGKQGFMHGEQFYAVVAPNRGGVSDITERPKPANCKRTLYEIKDLVDLITPEKQEIAMGKYSRWWAGDIETVIVAIWCIGGIISEPLKDELTPSQKEYIDILSTVYERRGKNIDHDVLSAATESFARLEKLVLP